MNFIRAALILGLAFVLLSCHVKDESTRAVPIGQSGSSTEQPTTETPLPLPFENRFPNRWNGSNNGSPYEPCVAFSNDELARFQVDPASIEDAALVDRQGTRGCNWIMQSRFGIGQVVTNSESLASYRRGTAEYDWRPEFEAAGRVVGLFALAFDDSGACSTYVQSLAAGVVTNVVVFDSGDGRTAQACKLVEDFTRAYIDKIPG